MKNSYGSNPELIQRQIVLKLQVSFKYEYRYFSQKTFVLKYEYDYYLWGIFTDIFKYFSTSFWLV